MWLYGYITWCGTKSLDSHHKITPIYINICLLFISVEKKWNQWKKASPRVSLFHVYNLTWKKNELILWTPRVVISKSWYQLLLQTVQKSQQNFAVNKHYKKWLEGYKKKKSLSELLTYQLTMASAERLSTRIHLCPPSFTSWPTKYIPFLDNFSTTDICSRQTSCLIRHEGVYLLNT